MDEHNPWQIFQTYNIYRICLIGILVIYHYVELSTEGQFLGYDANTFYLLIGVYAFFVCYFIFKAKRQDGAFETIVLSSAFLDLLLFNSFILKSVSLTKGIGILLNVSIAALAILVPGISALFFAAFESILLLSYSYYHMASYGTSLIFYAGIHGMGFFMIAFTSASLAYWLNKNRQLAAQRSKDLYSLQKLNQYIVEKTESAILFIDANFLVIYVNKAALRLFSVDKKILPCHLSSFSKDLVELCQDSILQTAAKEAHRYNLKNSELMVKVIPYLSEDNTSYVLMLDNPKHIIQQAQQLKLASLGRFTASIAHELRNPLAAISHAIQLLQEKEEQSPQEKRLFQIIMNNCTRMNELIKNVLQLSRQQQSQPTIISLKQILKKLADEYLPYQDLRIDLDKVKDGIEILFDQSQFIQLMMIFIENAIKYGKNEKEETVIHYETKIKENGTTLLLIHDEGEGVKLKDENKIFEPFFTTSRTGVGLGLFLAKELCAANKADLTLNRSKPQNNTCFVIEFLMRE